MGTLSPGGARGSLGGEGHQRAGENCLERVWVWAALEAVDFHLEPGEEVLGRCCWEIGLGDRERPEPAFLSSLPYSVADPAKWETWAPGHLPWGP